MDSRILGPLEVWSDEIPVRLGGGKQRALLAILLLSAGRTVATLRLVDELWGEDVPDTVTKMVQICPDGINGRARSSRSRRADRGMPRVLCQNQ
jgi:hypothetical protein